MRKQCANFLLAILSTVFFFVRIVATSGKRFMGYELIDGVAGQRRNESSHPLEGRVEEKPGHIR